jgi:hypothetical protein
VVSEKDTGVQQLAWSINIVESMDRSESSDTN